MDNNNMDDAMIPLMPIWDVILEVSRVQEIADTMAILTSDDHVNTDVEAGRVSVIFLDLSERLYEVGKTFAKARENVKFLKEGKLI